MKAVLEFNLGDPEERLEHKRAVSATAAYLVLWDTWQEVFRPARKHGYTDEPRLNELLRLNDSDNEVSVAVAEAIRILEKKFHGILEERGISLDDLE